VHLRRQVLEQKREGQVNRLVPDDVVIVQDQDEGVEEGADFIEQGCQDCFSRRRLGRLKQLEGAGADMRGQCLQSRGQVA